MSKHKNISTVIFDLGGVLLNLDWNLCIANFEKLGIKEMAQLLSTTLQKGFVLDYEKGLINSDEFRNHLRAYSTQKITDEQINDAWTSFLVEIPTEKLELLLELRKKYNVFMLSNTNTLSFEFCERTMFNTNGRTIDDYFDKCYLSYRMHLCKPNADIFEALLADAGLKAEECLFLDDGIHNIETAEKLGFNVEFIKPYSGLGEWKFLK